MVSSQELLIYMNKVHKLALEDYLYAYGGASVFDKIMNVRLLKIDLRCMTIAFNHRDIEYDIEKVIIFEPPLENLSEAKGRLNSMAREAAVKRHLAHFQINDMEYPKSFIEYLVLFAVCLPPFCYKYRSLLYWLPIPSHLCHLLDDDLVLKTIICLEFLTHLVETLILLKPKLRFYRVPPDYLIEWYAFGILEGYAPVRRLSKMATKLEAISDIGD